MISLSSVVGGSLFGVRHGQGRPWGLALHGWQRVHRDFDAVLDGFGAIALDLPGFGATPPPPSAWRRAECAATIAPVLDEMADSVVIIGHSFGGKVSVHLAAAHPGRVTAQVLMDVHLTRPLGPRPRAPRSFRIGRVPHRGHLISDGRMEALHRTYFSADYRNAVGILRPILVKSINEDSLAPLAACSNPVELVWGATDGDVPVVVVQIAVDHSPGDRARRRSHDAPVGTRRFAVCAASLPSDVGRTRRRDIAAHRRRRWAGSSEPAVGGEGKATVPALMGDAP